MSYWEHIKEAYDKTSIYDDDVIFRRDLAQLPAHVGDLLAAHWTLSPSDREVATAWHTLCARSGDV